MTAPELMKGVYDGGKPSVRKRVIAVGGGFTAADTARIAVRLGAGEVCIAYRRTRDEMPATKEETAEAEAEGIKVMYLVAPKSIEAANGHVAGIRLVNQVRNRYHGAC